MKRFVSPDCSICVNMSDSGCEIREENCEKFFAALQHEVKRRLGQYDRKFRKEKAE